MEQISFKIRVSAAYATDSTDGLIRLLESCDSNEGIDLAVDYMNNQKIDKIEFFADGSDWPFGFYSKKQEKAAETEELLKNIKSGKADGKVRLMGCDGNNILARLYYQPVAPEKKAHADGLLPELESRCKELVKKGIVPSQEKMDLIVDIGKMHGMSDQLILNALNQSTYDAFNPNCEEPNVIYQNPNGYGKSGSPLLEAEIAFTVTVKGRSRIMQLFSGPLATGKNVAHATFAFFNNLQKANMGACRDTSTTDFAGTKSTNNEYKKILEGERGKELSESYLIYTNSQIPDNLKLSIKEDAAEYTRLSALAATVSIVQEKPPFVKLLEEGGAMMIDEINMMPPNILQWIANPIGDGSGYVTLPGHGRIKVHPNFVLMGSQNPNYIGSFAQNTAALSRFAHIEFSAPKDIISILKADIGEGILDDKYFEQTKAFYDLIAGAVKKGDVDEQALNIRGFAAALKAVANCPFDTTLGHQINVFVINALPEGSGKSSLKRQLYDLVSL